MNLFDQIKRTPRTVMRCHRYSKECVKTADPPLNKQLGHVPHANVQLKLIKQDYNGHVLTVSVSNWLNTEKVSFNANMPQKWAVSRIIKAANESKCN